MNTSQALVVRAPNSGGIAPRPDDELSYQDTREPTAGLSVAQVIAILRFYWKITLVVVLGIIAFTVAMRELIRRLERV